MGGLEERRPERGEGSEERLEARVSPVASETCPLCRDRIEAGVASLTCGGCSTTYHSECLAELGGCATLGCERKGQIPLPPASVESLEARSPATSERASVGSNMSNAACLGSLFGVLAGLLALIYFVVVEFSPPAFDQWDAGRAAAQVGGGVWALATIYWFFALERHQG